MKISKTKKWWQKNVKGKFEISRIQKWNEIRMKMRMSRTRYIHYKLQIHITNVLFQTYTTRIIQFNLAVKVIFFASLKIKILSWKKKLSSKNNMCKCNLIFHFNYEHKNFRSFKSPYQSINEKNKRNYFCLFTAIYLLIY